MPIRHSRTILSLLAALALACPAAASAQTAPASRHELAVFGGASIVELASDERDGPVILGGSPIVPAIFPGPLRFETSLGGSAELGARYVWHATDLVSLAADVSIAPSHKLTETTSFGCPDGRVCILDGITFLAPDIRRTSRVAAYHYGATIGIGLGERTVRPSIVAGLGGVTFDGDSLRATRFVVRIGAALSAGAGPVTPRLEVVDVIVADHVATGRTEHDIHVRVGVGVRW